MAFGLVDNILVYSYGLKRKSRTNIILGGFSGGAPALIGYVAVTTTGMTGFVELQQNEFAAQDRGFTADRKSTRLNSSHT